MLKKSLVIAMAGAMVIAMAGCGSSSDSSASSAKAESSAASSAAESSAAESSAAESSAAASSSAAETSEESFKIGFSDFSLSAEYQAKLRDKFVEAVADKFGDTAEVIVVDGESDSDTQNSGVDNLIAQGVDAIVLVPFDAEQQIPAVQACVDAGIPCFETCLQTADDGLRTSFIGSDDTTSGEMAMEYLAEKLDYEGDIVYLHGPTGQDSEIKRHTGANNVVDAHDGLNVVAEKVCNWDRAEAMDAIDNLLNSGMNIDGIFCENDEMALGAYAAIQGTDYEGKILITGVDGIGDALTAIKDGSMLCTSFQDALLQATTTADAVYAYLHGEEVESYYEVPYQLITSDNVDDEYWTK